MFFFATTVAEMHLMHIGLFLSEVDWSPLASRSRVAYSSQSVDWQQFSRRSRLTQSIIRSATDSEDWTPHPRGLCVRWGPSSLPKKEAEPPPQFSAHVHCGQTPGWIKMALGMVVGLCQRHIVLDGDPAPHHKKGAEPPSNFRRIFIVAKRLDASRCHLVWR